MNYHREHFMIFDCDYDLHNYPFDTQLCTIDLQLSKFDKEFVRLVPSMTGNKGPSALDQFVVTKVDLKAYNNDSLIKCKIHMKRVPLYFIATTFMPTICILFMALVTLFIDQSHFKASVTVTLTATLATLTLYNTIQQKLPADPGLGTGTFFMLFDFCEKVLRNLRRHFSFQKLIGFFIIQ